MLARKLFVSKRGVAGGVMKLAGVMLAAWMLAGIAAGQEKAVASGEWRVTSDGAQAAVPRLIRFSGRLKKLTGEPESGVIGVTFAIYAEPEGGAPLWMETQNVRLEEGGKYTVLLGANSDEGVPMELFKGSGLGQAGVNEQGVQKENDNAETQSSQRGGERWLGVEGPGIQQTPRVLLVSVPFALKAADAETLGGLPASAFVLAGTTATGGASAVPASSGAGGSSAGTRSSVGTNKAAGTTKPKAQTTTTAADNDDFVPKFDASANLVPSAIYELNGNVGIGTTNPTTPLQVNGNVLLAGQPTEALQLTGAATSGRVGEDASGTFLASDTNGSPLRFLTNNGSSNEWMRIGSTGSVNIGSAQSAQNGEMVFARDDQDRVHSAIGQAGSQYHFRLSRATPDVDGFNDFLISPYLYGMAIEYPGTLEVWSGNFSVHANPRYSPMGRLGANLWVGDEVDSGGLYVTSLDNGGGTASNVMLAADRFNHTSHGSLNFVVRNTTDAFKFDVGAYGSEVMAGQISGTGSASSLDLFSGTVQATLRAQSGSSAGTSAGSASAGGTSAGGTGSGAQGGGVQLGSTSNNSFSLFTNNGAAQVTLFPSGNFSIGNTTDTAPLAVGSAAQFQVSATGAATIGGGTAITRHLSVSVALAFPAFPHRSCNTLTVGVTGAADGDSVALGIPGAVGSIDGLEWFGWVSAPDTVSVRGCNVTDHEVAVPPAANVRVDVWQH